MARCNKRSSVLGFFALLALPAAHAATDTTVHFEANINETCDIKLDRHTIHFGVLRTSSFTPQFTGAIQPITATVECDNTSPAPGPKITVTGTTPFAGNNAVFRDVASTAAGLGFMVQKDTGTTPSLAGFYDPGTAVSVTQPVTLGAVAATTPTPQKFWLGLVREAGVPAASVTGGILEATITFNVAFN
ncbi:fimbrial protein [Providencia rettgeri DSM 1131]|uniref:fimbrial protein n=1 Tax=Providencia rettgeri TaxID=587 RepID=UPI000197C013|nr:fimbrial protein [Providencia rettgeri]EFE54098.1 fimbrial protein [Providencia rettgeri DSM 1131]QXA57393.1 fimbrial protein [Providencia rettgeri]